MAKGATARQSRLAADAKQQHSPAHPLERLIFFSDAVFAIAITLLVIELHPPHFPMGTPDVQHVAALANLIPNFVAFFISFFVIGAFWAGHHRAFSLARHWSPKLLMPNILMLAAIAFMPFVTAYMGTNIGQRVPAVLYNAALMVTGLLNLRLVRVATSFPVVDEQADPLVVARTRARGWGVTLGAAVALLLAFVFPIVSQFGLLTIPLWLKLSIGRAERTFAQRTRS